MIWIQNFIRKLADTIFALVKLILLSKFRTKIRYSAKDRDLIILGNGPSLTGLIEKGSIFLKDKDLICVNWFPQNELYESLKPSIYITAAPELWINTMDDAYLKRREKL